MKSNGHSGLRSAGRRGIRLHLDSERKPTAPAPWRRRTIGGLLTLLLILAAVWPAAAAGNAAVGAKIFAARCARCHGKDGKGNGPDLAKLHPSSAPVDWTNPVVMHQWADQEIINIITKGGKAVGSSAVMPPFKGKLTPDQIQDLLAFIRSLAK